jgi:hypothetical protein
MKSVDYLYAALIATALIHGIYLANLFSRYRRLKRELKDLGRTSGV